MPPPLTAEPIRLANDDQVVEYYHDQGWTDGLPIIAPTEERIRQFLAKVRLDPDVTVAEYQPRARQLTAEKVAINAIMAGCKPYYLPV